MKHLYLIIIAFGIYTNLIVAQPNVPLTFKNIQPKWLHYSYDPNLP